MLGDVKAEPRFGTLHKERLTVLEISLNQLIAGSASPEQEQVGAKKLLQEIRNTGSRKIPTGQERTGWVRKMSGIWGGEDRGEFRVKARRRRWRLIRSLITLAVSFLPLMLRASPAMWWEG